MIICDDDYRNKNAELFPGGINIYVFNIDKFNKERSKMKALNEYLGQSFFEYLASLDDLVLLMDESHHYRAEKGAAALNELNPLLGLETTATPIVTKNSKQTLFKNVVYEYPLSKAIADGYTRTPYAVTRKDIAAYNFGEEQLDKMMISDGIICHERTKQFLKDYAQDTGNRLVKCSLSAKIQTMRNQYHNLLLLMNLEMAITKTRQLQSIPSKPVLNLMKT